MQRRLIGILIAIGWLALWLSQAFADDGQSANYRLKFSVLNSSGESANSTQYKLKWGTIGETASGPFASPSYKVFASFPAQLNSLGGHPQLQPSPLPLLDRTPPTISNLIPPDGTMINQVRPTISADYADNPEGSGILVSSVVLTLDGINVTPQANVTASRVTFVPQSDLAQENHTFTINVSDHAGNTAVEAHSTFTIDSIPPTITNLVPVTGSYLNNPRPAISADFADNQQGTGINLSTLVLVADGIHVTSQATITSSHVSFTPSSNMADGLHSFTVSVSDNAGNPSQQSSGFTIDTIPPILFFTSPVDLQNFSQPSLAVRGFVNDPNLSTVTINGIPATINQNTFSAPVNLAEGSNVLAAVATDLAQNQRSQLINVTLDTVPPVVAITSPADQAVINQVSVTVEGTLNDPNASVFVGQSRAVIVSPGVWRALGVPLSMGVNQIVAQAADPAGNQAQASITIQTNSQTNPVALNASPQSGTSPLNVTLSPVTSLPNPVSFQYDWEGDGVVDMSVSDSNPVNHTYSAVNLYQPSVTVETSIGTLTSANTTINVHEPASVQGTALVPQPVDIKVDATGLIYVLSRSQAQILVYRFDNATTSFILQQTISGDWNVPEGFDLNEDLALFVADTGNHRIQKLIPDIQANYALDPSFGTNGSIGSFGHGQGQFSSPFDVALDEANFLYVSDSGNHRIQKFNPSGTFLLAFGTFGQNQGQFDAPKGLVFNSQTIELLVADSNNHRIEVFDSGGNFTSAFGSFGSGQGQFRNPSSVSTDIPFKELIMVDQQNNRLQLFTESSTFLQELSGLGFSVPQAVAAPRNLGSNRILYTADTGNNQIARVMVPQGSSSDDPLSPYYNLIAALQAEDVDAAVSNYVLKAQDDRRAFFERVRVNLPDGLREFGDEMAQDPAPILLSKTTDSAIFGVVHLENGTNFGYELHLLRKNSQWKILQL